VRDGSLYTGLTTDPERRLQQHSVGRGARYTRSTLPSVCPSSKSIPTWSPPCRRERVLKAMPRRRKLELIAAPGRRQPETEKEEHA